MAISLFLCASVILLCVLLNRFAQRFGVPILLAFIVLGLAFGIDGILKIPFEDYGFAEKACSVALVFIMFYGGFGTNWKQARPVAVPSALLSTIGVALTAALTGLFCRLALGLPLLEGLLVGAVLASTDAASVFSILRSKKLGLKEHTGSMLELESGSNDPGAYMLTVILLSAMGEGISAAGILWLVFAQVFFGALFGVAIGLGAAWAMRRLPLSGNGFDMACLTGIALLSYAAAALAGGNGYLSAYLCGILLGNHNLPNKKALVHYFDGVTGLMQMLVFFLLGLLATPSRIPGVFLPALFIMLFLTLVARPLAVFTILHPFKCSRGQRLLVSFAGLRGAASIVFAIMATVSPPDLSGDLFHVVFCIVLLSISLQGTLLPLCAKRLGMTDSGIDARKIFSDYSEQADLRFIRFQVEAGHPWAGQEIRGVPLPPQTLIVLLLRGGQRIVPDGKTVLQGGDTAVLAAYQYSAGDDIALQEYEIAPGSEWAGKTIRAFSPQTGELVVMIIRGSRTIVPKGGTKIKSGDILVLLSESGVRAV